MSTTPNPSIGRRYNATMPCRLIIVLFAACVLSGCAHEAKSYRKEEGMVTGGQERAFAGCQAAAEPILEKSGRVMGLTAYHQAISDCMRAQGYDKL